MVIIGKKLKSWHRTIPVPLDEASISRIRSDPMSSHNLFTAATELSLMVQFARESVRLQLHCLSSPPWTTEPDVVYSDYLQN